MTPEQKDMLLTLRQHGDVSAVSYRLTFSPAEQKWAKTEGYVERVRGSYRLTGAGRLALSLSPAKQD